MTGRKYYWARTDWVTYKVPVQRGKVIIPLDYMQPGYEIDIDHLKFAFVKTDNRLLGDFLSFGNAAFLVNQRGNKVFENALALHGRRFSTKCGGETYQVFLCDILLAGFDLERSIYTRLGLYESAEEDMDQIIRLALKPDFTTEADIFRLDGSFVVQNNLLVSDRFLQQYELAGLKGLLFTSTDPNDWDYEFMEASTEATENLEFRLKIALNLFDERMIEVDRQRQTVAKLAATGQDPTQAKRQLDLLENVQRAALGHISLMKRQLECAPNGPRGA